MQFTPGNIAALVIAASFAAGLNVYATILTLGLLARFHWVILPPGLEGLAHTWVIVASGLLFSAEFVADKIPGIDLAWSALHTFVRVPVAALLAYHTASQLTPEMQLLATVAGGLISLVAHGSKTAVRAVVTPSPEPISNMVLSTGEDAAAIGLTWLATMHPWIAGSLAAGLTIIGILMTRWIIRMIRKLWRRFRGKEDRYAASAVSPELPRG